MLDRKHPHDALERDADGKIRKNEGNLLKALSWAGIELSYDEFGGEYGILGLDGYGFALDDDALDELYLLIDREYYLKPSVQDFRRIVKSAARRNRYHPVRNYLDGLRWDGEERIEEWLIRFAGAEDTPFVRAVSRIVLIAAVRRIRKPGCKFDEMLVLESPEGTGKSTCFSILAGDYFTDCAPLHAPAREVIELLRGRWIVECADLAGMRKGEVETLKAFLSRTEDSATLKYKEETTRFKRQCIFVGTTNESSYLLSTTGNRRFWPVKVAAISHLTLTLLRDQLWAEAAACEADGESIRLPEDLWEDARQEQELRMPIDEWEGLVADWLETQERERNLLSPAGPRTTLSKVADGALGLKADKLDQRVIERIAKCLRKAGWYMKRSNSKRWWYRTSEPNDE